MHGDQATYMNFRSNDWPPTPDHHKSMVEPDINIAALYIAWNPHTVEIIIVWGSWLIEATENAKFLGNSKFRTYFRLNSYALNRFYISTGSDNGLGIEPLTKALLAKFRDAMWRH